MDNGGDLFVGVAGGAGGSARGSSSSSRERGHPGAPGWPLRPRGRSVLGRGGGNAALP